MRVAEQGRQQSSKCWQLLFLFCSMLLSQLSYGQYTIEGTVQDSTGHGVPYANILLYTQADTTMTAFGTSTPQGTYRLTIPGTRPSFLRITNIAYQTQDVPLTFGRDTLLLLDIVLRDKVQELDELVFEREPPVRERSDTLVFSAADFGDGTEGNVEGLLAKIPGLAVDETGQITFNGKPVKKVLIQGDDLFDRDYTLLTRNMGAAGIEQVEVLRDYVENPLLKGIQQSDDIALNLGLKQGQKQEVFGEVKAGAGTRERYEGRANLIALLPRVKVISFGSINNTGQSTEESLFLLNTTTQFDNRFVGDDWQSLRPLRWQTQVPGVPDTYSNFNKARLGSLNLLLPLGKRLKAKVVSFYQQDETDDRRTGFNTYLLDRPFTNTESYRLLHAPARWHLSTELRYQWNPKSNLIYTGLWNHLRTAQNNALQFNGSAIMQALQDTLRLQDHRLAWTRRLGGQSALQVQARIREQQLPQSLRADSLLFGDLLPPALRTPAAAIQDLQRNQYNKGLQVQYYATPGPWFYQLHFGYTEQKQSLHSSLSVEDQAGAVQTLDVAAYQNRLQYTVQEVRASAAAGREWKNSRLSTQLAAHRLQSSLSQGAGETASTHWYMVPELRFRQRVAGKHGIALRYHYDALLPAAEQVAAGRWLRDYRNLQQGYGRFALLRRHDYRAVYTYGRVYEPFYLQVHAGNTINPSFWADSSRVLPAYQLSTTVLLSNQSMQDYGLTMDKFLWPLASNIKLKAGYQRWESKSSINEGAVVPISNQRIVTGMEWKTAFEGKVNFHAGTEYESLRSRFDALSTTTQNQYSFLDVLYEPAKRWKIKASGVHSLYNVGRADQNSLSRADLQISHAYADWLQVELFLHNLLNNTAFTSLQLDNYYYSTTQYRLQPRYLMVRITCSL